MRSGIQGMVPRVLLAAILTPAILLADISHVEETAAQREAPLYAS